MANVKKNTFRFHTGKQIKLHGNSMAISKSLEIGEGFLPNIFSGSEKESGDRASAEVTNPHKLTAEELMELADHNILLWMELKTNIRKYGIENSSVFNQE
jgi:hypothetical protein